MNFGLAGKFTLHKQKVLMQDGKPVLDNDGNQILLGNREKVAEFNNLITDNGLDNYIQGNCFDYFYLSSDNTAPTVNDVTLPALLGGSNTQQTSGLASKQLTTPPYYISHYQTNRFPAGVGTGNIAKIGVGWGTSSTVQGLWSSALVKDSNGNPTAISKLADEVLDVTYELKKYIPSTDFTGQVTISGEPYNVVVRVAELKESWAGDRLSSAPFVNHCTVFDATNLGGITGYLQGYTKTADKEPLTYPPYVKGSCKQSFVASFALNEANFEKGIKAAEFYLNDYTDCWHWQVSFAKVSDGSGIMKTANHTLTLPPFSIGWGRYEGAL